MGLLSVDLLITLQILPVFFSNCLFLALYDSVILLKHMVLFLSRSKAARGEWRRMLTSEGLRCVWNSFLLDAYKQVGAGHRHGPGPGPRTAPAGGRALGAGRGAAAEGKEGKGREGREEDERVRSTVSPLPSSAGWERGAKGWGGWRAAGSLLYCSHSVL